MKKKVALVLAIALLVCLFAGCSVKETGNISSESTTTAASDGKIVVTDHAGVEVELPDKIERIAICGIFPLASVLTLFFNSAERIVAMPKASMAAAQNGLLGKLYPEILNAETECVSGDLPNTEELLKLKPDVVFYSESDAATGEALRNAGFAAVGIAVNQWGYNCIETLNAWIALLDRMFPGNGRAEKVKSASDEIYQLVQERVKDIPDEERERVFILFQYSDTALMTSGKIFFGQWWCEAAGAINVAGDVEKENALPVNMEQIYAWNPSVILVTNYTTAQPEDILNSTVGEDDWSGLDAVKNGRVYKTPLGMYRSYTPGADAPVTLLWLAKTLYPERFEDIDVTEHAKTYYSEVFGIDLTDEQVESIFKPVSEAAGGIGG